MEKMEIEKRLKKVTIDKNRAYQNILEWLYANDCKYPDKLQWREKLLEMLKFNFDHLKNN
jgi:hypothetical protein